MTILRRTLRQASLALLLGGGAVVGGAACDSTKAVVNGTGGTIGLGGANGGGGAPGGGAAGSPGGGAAGSPGGAGGAGGAGPGIALVDWVTDLTDNHTNEVSPPDTVADKNIIDTDNPAAFDPLLAR